MKYVNIVIVFLAFQALNGCAYQNVTPMDDSRNSPPIDKSFLLTNGIEISLQIPIGGDEIGFIPDLDLDKIETFGRLLDVGYEKPFSFFKPYPNMFSISLNLSETVGEEQSYLLSKRPNRQKSEIIRGHSLSWTCDFFMKILQVAEVEGGFISGI